MSEGLGRFTRLLLRGLAIVLVWFVVFLVTVFVLCLLLVVGLLLVFPDHRVSSRLIKEPSLGLLLMHSA